jgi:hypothetical protein
VSAALLTQLCGTCAGHLCWDTCCVVQPGELACTPLLGSTSCSFRACSLQSEQAVTRQRPRRGLLHEDSKHNKLLTTLPACLSVCLSVCLSMLPCRILHLGRTEAGRQAIVDTLHLCGSAATALPNQEAVLGLQNDVIGTFQGLAQVRGGEGWRLRGTGGDPGRWAHWELLAWEAEGHCLVLVSVCWQPPLDQPLVGLTARLCCGHVLVLLLLLLLLSHNR